MSVPRHLQPHQPKPNYEIPLWMALDIHNTALDEFEREQNLCDYQSEDEDDEMHR